ASGTYPLGSHIITFSATDMCGMLGQDSMRIVVVPEEVYPVACTQPTGPISLGEDGTVTLNAEDYVTLDNPCGEVELRASWDENGPEASEIVIECDDLDEGLYSFSELVTVFQDGVPIGDSTVFVLINDADENCAQPRNGNI